MSWKNRLELDHAIRIRFLDAAKESSVQVGSVSRVAVTGSDEARVDARAVAVPDVPPEIGNRFTGGYVNELAFDNDGHTGLVFADVAADVFAQDVVLLSISTISLKKLVNSPDQSPPQDSAHKSHCSQTRWTRAYTR